MTDEEYSALANQILGNVRNLDNIYDALNSIKNVLHTDPGLQVATQALEAARDRIVEDLRVQTQIAQENAPTGSAEPKDTEIEVEESNEQ